MLDSRSQSKRLMSTSCKCSALRIHCPAEVWRTCVPSNVQKYKWKNIKRLQSTVLPFLHLVVIHMESFLRETICGTDVWKSPLDHEQTNLLCLAECEPMTYILENVFESPIKNKSCFLKGSYVAFLCFTLHRGVVYRLFINLYMISDIFKKAMSHCLIQVHSSCDLQEDIILHLYNRLNIYFPGRGSDFFLLIGHLNYSFC